MGLFRRRDKSSGSSVGSADEPDINVRARDPWYWPTQTLGNTAQILTGWPDRGADSTALAVPTFYRCVDLISTMIGEFPVRAFPYTDETTPKERQPAVLRRPDPDLDLFEFQQATVADYLMRGNFYWLVTARQPDGYPLAVMLLPVEQVQCSWDPETALPRRRRYQWMGNELDPGDVIHGRGFTPPGSPTGVGAVQAAAGVIDGQYRADAAARSNFTDGTYPAGVIEHPTALSPIAAEILADQFVAAHAGNRRPAVMSGGAKYNPVAITARDSQWIEHRQWTAGDIARMMGVPLGLLQLPVMGGTNLTYTNLRELRTDFLHTGLAGPMARLRSAYGRLLPSTQVARFDTTKYLPPLEATEPQPENPATAPAADEEPADVTDR